MSVEGQSSRASLPSRSSRRQASEGWSREHELFGLDDPHETATLADDDLTLPVFEQPARGKGTDVGKRGELVVLDPHLDVRPRRRSEPRAETRQRARQSMLGVAANELHMTVGKLRDVGKRHLQHIPGHLWIRVGKPLNHVTGPLLHFHGIECFRGPDVRVSRQQAAEAKHIPWTEDPEHDLVPFAREPRELNMSLTNDEQLGSWVACMEQHLGGT